MPPRMLAVLIVGFWVATTSWLVWRDLYPRFRTGEPPPIGIDLADEANQKDVRWRVYRNDKPIGRARTWTVYEEADDTYALHSEAKNLELQFSLLATLRLQQIKNVYHVSRSGELRALSSNLRADIKSALLKEDIAMAAALSGTVRDGRFLATGTYEFSSEKQEFKLDPIDMPARAAVLNPLHPVNRLTNVRPGQRWRMPLLDPLAAAVQRSLPAMPGTADARPRYLDAEVLGLPRSLEWDEGEANCLVIEYRNDGELVARTWVHANDGRVLRQEAMQGGEMLVLQRE